MPIERILEIIKEILIIIGLLASIRIGYPLLRKRLTEDHVKDLVKDIQLNNKRIKEHCHELLDKNLSRSIESKPLSKTEIENILKEVNEIFKLSLNASLEVTTLAFYFKSMLQNLLKYYPGKNQGIILISTSFYGLYSEILAELITYSTKIVNIPKNSNTKQFRYINKKITPFLSNMQFRKFRYIEQGIDNRIASPIAASFFSRVNQTNDVILFKSAYKIKNSPIPIVRIMYLHKIYFPVILRSKQPDSILGTLYLHLIGFSIQRSITLGKDAIETLQLQYLNISDGIEFIDSIKHDQIFEEFNDGYLHGTKIDQKKIILIRKGQIKNIEVKIHLDHAKNLFSAQKKPLKKMMKSEIR